MDNEISKLKLEKIINGEGTEETRINNQNLNLGNLKLKKN